MISFSTSKQRRSIAAAVTIGAGLVLSFIVPASAQNYEGPHQVRVGAFLQGGGTTLDGTYTPNGGVPINGSGSFETHGAGITAGLEFLRYGGWTWGVEGDFGETRGAKAIVNSQPFSTDYFGSLRGRLGFYARPDLVLYGTAGLGFRGVRVVDVNGFAADKSLLGGVYGAGGEYHRGNTIFFAEYLHNDYSSRTLTPLSLSATTATVVATAGDTYGVKGSSDSFRIGVKFKVGFDGYYDEVRDGLRK